MSELTDHYEAGVDKLAYGETAVSDFSLYSYASKKLQEQINVQLSTGQSRIPEIEDAENATRQSLSSDDQQETIEHILTENTLGALSYYLGKTDRALEQVFTPNSVAVRSGTMTYGEAITKSIIKSKN